MDVVKFLQTAPRVKSIRCNALDLSPYNALQKLAESTTFAVLEIMQNASKNLSTERL